eukprot:m.266250 g.266250  ORF g.266250 m.266250 type:complete len:602 (-) comp66128_c0_seq1:218-2023(-)
MILFGTPQFGEKVPPLQSLGKLLPLSPFDHAGWIAGSLKEKMRIGASSWCDVGFGAPAAIYGFYVLKHWFWLSMWGYFASFSAARVVSEDPVSWMDLILSHDAMMRLVLWNLMFESLGFGCASGALTGRFTLPSAAMFHWFWVGSMKLPFRLDGIDGKHSFLPGIGTTRTVLDVGLYTTFLMSVLNALTSPTIGVSECAPIVLLLMLLGFLDYTIWLAARSEVYMYIVVCYLFIDSSVPLDDELNHHVWTGAKCCQLAIWMWASVSKWGEWFPFVVQIMVCNSMVFPFTLKGVHNAMFRNAANGDFRVSTLCWTFAHFGTVSEFLFPVLLLMSDAAFDGNVYGTIGIVIAYGFHIFIFLQIAMGAPQEWNIFTIFNATFLFARDGGVSRADLIALPLNLKIFLLIALVGVPLVGNLFPRYVSFLPAMRYYAGNWPISGWVIKRSAVHKLNNIKSACGSFHDQAWMIYGPPGVRQSAEAKILAWLSLHLHGRLFPTLLPKAMGPNGKLGEADSDYEFFPGELVAGQALGYNFGDGFLHGPFFLNAVQERCNFEKGECIQIFINSCSIVGTKYPWWIKDATDAFGSIAKGEGDVHVLKNTQPY